MIEYKLFETKKKAEILEEELNSLAQIGWRVICSCGKNGTLVLGKEKQTEVAVEVVSELEPTIQPPRIVS